MRESPSLPPETQPSLDGRVNLLHMELFHHFENVTAPTLAFTEIWGAMIRLALQEEYLMSAILAVAARHLSILQPDSPWYARAALILLSKACADFRAVLGRELTTSNCDARLGTAILIHYLTWCDLEFLDGQQLVDDGDGTDDGAPEGKSQRRLNLSHDKLFLLSPGVRQIFFMSWPVLQAQGSVFVGAAVHQACDIIDRIVEARGLNWKRVVRKFMDMYDDPRLRSDHRKRATRQPSDEEPSRLSSDPRDESPGLAVRPCPERGSSSQVRGLAVRTVAPPPSFDEYVLAWLPPGGTVARSKSLAMVPADATYVREAFESVVTRLAIILVFLDDQTNQDPERTSKLHSIPAPSRTEIERYFLAFPLLCMGRFLELILVGDSRALAVLYHMYRAARVLISSPDSWWAIRRSAVMERVLRRELQTRGWEEWLWVSGKDHQA
jgi:hypothetical protein